MEDGRRVAHTLEVMQDLKDTYSKAQDVEDSARGYVIANDEAFLQRYHEAIAQLPARMDNLTRLTADNPAQQRRLAELKPLLQKRLEHAATLIALRRERKLFLRIRKRVGIHFVAGMEAFEILLHEDQEKVLVINLLSFGHSHLRRASPAVDPLAGKTKLDPAAMKRHERSRVRYRNDG